MFGHVRKLRWQMSLKRNAGGWMSRKTEFQSRYQRFPRFPTARSTAQRPRAVLDLSTLTSSSSSRGKNLIKKLDAKQMSSSSTDDPDDQVESEMEEMAIDHSVDVETDDDLSHLRVRLYPTEEDDKLRDQLERIHDSSSIQQVFDLVEEFERDAGEINNVKIASQALVTIWDLQKFLFKISANFEPERDYLDKPSFIEKISQHPTFVQKVVKPVIDNCEKLEDEPLTASLFCLKRLNYSVRGLECEQFVDECLRRKEALSLPSVSRLCVCMRDESLYGNMIMANFYSLLWNYVDSMSEDLEVRLVSISLRNTLRIISTSMIEKFRSKIGELKDEIPKWETVTVCKVLLLLMACRNVGSDSKYVFDLVGEELARRVPKMMLMDLLSLQKFLELGYLQPYCLVEALVQRMMRIVQEGVSSSLSPRLDLLSSISPYLKSVKQRRQMTGMMQEYLDNHNFEFASGILLTMLRYVKSNDTSLYHTYWEKAADLVFQKEKQNVLDRKVLKLAKDYVNFCYSMIFKYRNREFETAAKSYIYNLIDNYLTAVQPSLLHPGDFSRAFGFLIGTASLSDPIFYDIDLLKTLDDFAPQFRASDLAAIARGIEAVMMIHFNNPKRHNPPPKYYDRVIEISSILEEQCSRLMLDPQHNLSFNDMHTVHKVALVTRRVKGDSPIVEQSMKQLLRCSVDDARAVKDLAHILLIGNNNYPEASDIMSSYIWDHRSRGISPEVVEKFVTASFINGWDNADTEIMGFCGEQLTRNWERLSFLHLLQMSLGLCYYRQLPKEVVQNVFSVEFLDQIDAELAATYNAAQYPLKLRQAMMELNRAVCIDMPDVNLPWFHGKFCEEVLAMTPIQETYLHAEVRNALSHIVGDEAAVQFNMYSPYYYRLDYLIEFDEKNRPIKKYRRQHIPFFQKFRKSQDNVRRKVAVLILAPQSFTRGVRALKGNFKLRRRHLEMLGYDVIEIDPVHWNSMFMSEHVVKQNYLETRLYANAHVG